MSKTDDFDDFLQSGFATNKHNIADEGFTKGVIEKLPAKRVFSINRNFILFLSGAISVFIFVISNGYRFLFNSIIDVYNHINHLIRPSFISFIVLLVFISVSFIVSKFVRNEDLI